MSFALFSAMAIQSILTSGKSVTVSIRNVMKADKPNDNGVNCGCGDTFTAYGTVEEGITAVRRFAEESRAIPGYIATIGDFYEGEHKEEPVLKGSFMQYSYHAGLKTGKGEQVEDFRFVPYRYEFLTDEEEKKAEEIIANLPPTTPTVYEKVDGIDPRD